VLETGESDRVVALPEPAPRCGSVSDEGIDLSLLEDSLSKTPWERMQANDDALRYADSLRAAMEKRNAAGIDGRTVRKPPESLSEDRPGDCGLPPQCPLGWAILTAF
jgi:hypothetical protein